MSTTPEPDAILEPPAPEVKRYARRKIGAVVAAVVLNGIGLAVFALLLGPRIHDRIFPLVGDQRWWQLIIVAFVLTATLEALTLPIDFWSGFLLEHRYQLSNQSLGRWLWKRIKGYLVGGPLGLALVLGLYAVIWYGGTWWWAWATAGWLAVTLLLGRIAPVLILPLFFKVTPLDDPSLVERLRRLAEGTGLTVAGVYRLHLSADTKKANAALTGLGKSRRVLLGDTLLEQFTPEEIEVVFAHEVGHHVHRHLPKMIVWSVVVSAVGFFLVDTVLRWLAPRLGYVSFDQPAALPLVLLWLALLGFLLAPLNNAISRFFERQCDRYALRRTGFVDAYRSAFAKLAKLNKSDPDPHPLVVWLLYDHPPIRERIALADEA
ncbi:MAG: M48 family metalloprotease [Gemmataceae bacterium]